MISRIIMVEVSVISFNLRLQLITHAETLIIPDITKTECNNNCFTIHCFKENKDKCIMLKRQFNHPCHITLELALGNQALHAQPTDYSLIC